MKTADNTNTEATLEQLNDRIRKHLKTYQFFDEQLGNHCRTEIERLLKIPLSEFEGKTTKLAIIESFHFKAYSNGDKYTSLLYHQYLEILASLLQKRIKRNRKFKELLSVGIVWFKDLELTTKSTVVVYPTTEQGIFLNELKPKEILKFPKLFDGDSLEPETTSSFNNYFLCKSSKRIFKVLNKLHVVQSDGFFNDHKEISKSLEFMDSFTLKLKDTENYEISFDEFKVKHFPEKA